MELNISVAFIFGILSFFSPCILPLVPAYYAIITNQNIENSFLRLRGSLFFVTGFSFVFVSLASVASSIGSLLYRNLNTYKFIAGLLVIYFGLSLMLPLFSFKSSIKFWDIPFSNLNLKSLLVGVAFAFGFTPCIGPVLAALLTLSSSTETIREGLILLIFYSIGMGVPFIVLSITYGTITLKNKFVRSLSRYSIYISGSILVILGILLTLDRVYLLASYVQRLYLLIGLDSLSTI